MADKRKKKPSVSDPFYYRNQRVGKGRAGHRRTRVTNARRRQPDTPTRPVKPGKAEELRPTLKYPDRRIYHGTRGAYAQGERGAYGYIPEYVEGQGPPPGAEGPVEAAPAHTRKAHWRVDPNNPEHSQEDLDAGRAPSKEPKRRRKGRIQAQGTLGLTRESGDSPEVYAAKVLAWLNQQEPTQQFSSKWNDHVRRTLEATRGEFGSEIVSNMDTERVFGAIVPIEGGGLRSVGRITTAPKEESTAELWDKRYGRVNTEELWRTEWLPAPGVAGANPNTPLKDIIQSAHRKRSLKKPAEYLKGAPESEVAWLQQEMRTPGSPFFAADTHSAREAGVKQVQGARRRLEQYVAAHQEGVPTETLMHYFATEETRGRPPKVTSSVRRVSVREELAREEMKQRVQERYEGKAEAAKTRRGSSVSNKDFKYSMAAPGLPKYQKDVDELKKLHPEASEADLIAMREMERQAIDEMMLQQNARWQHEERAAKFNKGTKARDAASRVVVFTTSAGGPTVSVPSSSLLGQYVIKKRARMVVDTREAKRFQVTGEFPDAVRDRHLIESGVGFSVGAQGRYGLYKDVGWKKGTKTSKGYGQAIPAGARILRDQTGRPVYDDQGNVRYTHGYTRPFDVGTSKQVGFRVFVG